jgi:hypothetical protein
MKEKFKKASKIASIVLLSLLCVSMGAAVYAAVGVSVYIRNPLNSADCAEGVVSGNYWVGEIPATVSGDGEPAQKTTAYCINFDRTVYAGNTYSAELAAVIDTAEWRAVSYILTWCDPPADGAAAAANQVAIWRFINGTRGYDYVAPECLSSSLDVAGNALTDEVKDKDVVRQDDIFQWIEPVTANQSALVGNPGETIVFKAKLTDAFGTPRAGVRIMFTAVLRPDNVELNATHLSPMITHTDSNGIAEVTVTMLDDIQNGESIEVKASTRSLWPQL